MTKKPREPKADAEAIVAEKIETPINVPLADVVRQLPPDTVVGTSVGFSPQRPTVGRMVHFVREGYDVPHAAIITYVYSDEVVDLSVFPPGAPPTFGLRVPFSPEPLTYPATRRCWSWPPRS